MQLRKLLSLLLMLPSALTIVLMPSVVSQSNVTATNTVVSKTGTMDFQYWNTVVNLIAALAATVAVIVGGVSFYHNLNLQKRIATANVRPLLTLYYVYDPPYDMEIALVNAGLGTAVITKSSFKKGKQERRELLSVLKCKNDFKWSQSEIFDLRLGKKEDYLLTGYANRLIIAALSKNELKKQHFNNVKIVEIFDEVEEKILGVSLNISYRDVLGNLQTPFHEGLKLRRD